MTTAHDDQVNAAVAETTRVGKRIGDVLGLETCGRPSEHPSGRRVLEMLTVQLMRRTLNPCAHLTHDAPQPAIWLVASPEWVRCVPCAKSVSDQLRGTVADYLCDLCGGPARPMRHGVIQESALLILWGECQRCAVD